jgi:hypothetical protein
MEGADRGWKRFRPFHFFLQSLHYVAVQPMKAVPPGFDVLNVAFIMLGYSIDWPMP